MKEIVVLSAKGGTGKTSIVGSLAALAQSKVIADCDVDAADLHLLLQLETKESTEFRSRQMAVIDDGKCTACGLCEELCHFEAIREFKVSPISCEGYGFCSHICPAEATTMRENLAGYWSISHTKYGSLVHARLGIAQGNSGKLVAMIRRNARSIAEEQGLECIISDGPPRIGCPIISSLSGAHLAVLVTEFTLLGIHDLEHVIGVCQHFGISHLVCINKHDLNEENSRRIEDYCEKEGIELIARIPFNNVVTEALAQDVPVVKHSDSRISCEIGTIWARIDAFS